MTELRLTLQNNIQPNLKNRPSFRHGLLAVASGVALSLFLANSATAQNNDVDAFNGSENADCSADAIPTITSTPTNGRTGNSVSGTDHCIGALSVDNNVSGSGNTIVNSSHRNIVSGNQNTLSGVNNVVTGRSNFLQVSSDNLVGGQDNFLSGDSNMVVGEDNTVRGRGNAVSGLDNNIQNFANSNLVGGVGNSIENQGSNNVVSGLSNTLGTFAFHNAVSGNNNNIGRSSRSNLISGSNNQLGRDVINSVVMGANNDLCQDDGSGTCTAGGSNGSNSDQISIHVLGSNNNVHTASIAGSHVKILGDGNTINGSDSGWNVVTGHNATVEGTGNFVAGGNATDGAAATGNNDIVIGAGASATGDDIVAIGNRAEVTGTNAVAIGRDSEANGIRATAIGSNASANGLNAAALGSNAAAGGSSAFALGTNATANGTRSLAIGRDSEVDNTHTNSSAIGFGATTTLANQMMFGTTNTTYVMPGIVSTASRNRQSGAVYYVTSDANGNLAVTDDPVPPADNSATPDVSAMGDSGGSKTTGIASTDTDQDSVIDGSPLEGEPINNELIGSNLEFGGSPNSTPIPSNGLVNNVSSSDALSQASVNAEAIEVNRQEIQRNTIKIDQAFSRIAANGTAIEANALRITDVEEGLAAVAALPDMYLNPNETWAASSAVAVFGDQVGFGGTLAIRGSDNWSVGASAGVGGDEATGKIQFRYSGE